MKKVLIVLMMLLILPAFLIVGCEREKERPLLPTEKAWKDAHPDGEKMGPEDMKKWAIKDRCDPEIYIPWRRTVSAEDPDQSYASPSEFLKTNNKIPVAVMDIEENDGVFTFRGFRSNDPDGFIDIYKWAINGVWVSEEPSFTWEPPDKKGIYYVQLVVMDGSKGEGSVEYRTGSNVDITLKMDKILCSKE